MISTTPKYTAEPYTARQSERQILKSKVESLEADLKIKELEIESKNQEIKASEKAIEILQTQLETVAAEKNEYTLGLEERIELSGFKHTELNEKIQLLNKKIQEMQFSNPEKIECNHENEIKLLKEANARLEMQIKDSLPNVEDVFKPTADDLQKKLIELEPLVKKVNTLSEQITVLRDKAKITYELKSPTSEILKSALDLNDQTFIELCPVYLELYPTVIAELKKLDDMNNKGTHKPIPEEYCNAFSAKNKISSETMKANDAHFEKLLKDCKATYEVQKNLIEHIARRYEDVTGHLNDIDTKLGVLKQNSYLSCIDFISEYKQKIRTSPTRPNFVPITMDVKKNQVELVLDQVK